MSEISQPKHVMIGHDVIAGLIGLIFGTFIFMLTFSLIFKYCSDLSLKKAILVSFSLLCAIWSGSLMVKGISMRTYDGLFGLFLTGVSTVTILIALS